MERLNELPIRYLKGIGPKRAAIFNKIGIYSAEDLLYYFPRKYQDRSKFSVIAELKEGQTQVVRAKIVTLGQRRSFRRRQFSITEAIVSDQTGSMLCIWFNQAYLKDYLKPGVEIILYGKIEHYGSRIQMSAPEFEIINGQAGDSLHMGRIVPLYSLPQGISQKVFRLMIRNIIDEHLTKSNDFMPYDIRSRNNLLNLAKSLVNIHFPEDLDIQTQAYTRLSFEEFLLFQLPLVLRKLKRKEKPGIAHKVNGQLLKNFIAALPFLLTGAQQKAVDEIKVDMAKPQAMQRLLQGDVGSGKTVVATIASLMAIDGKYQVAFMAPTEILARQHYEKIRSQASGLRPQGKAIEIKLLTSSIDKKEKDAIIQEIKAGKIDLVIGTHALLVEEVQFKKLGLVIIDEQHKFGVGQRALLPKKGLNPDVLIMTATPIPRTLAITLYGDLDISVINELPPGRGSIKTLCFTGKDSFQPYNIVRQQVKLGKQAYIVYPVIEESYALDIAGAKKMYEHFKQGEFKEFRLGLIHGKLKQKEQDQIMLKFKEKELDILVSTTVLEVGIDIPGATCMVIQYAERFGLSQLHQLRGRVGRGKDESFCLLISDSQTPEASARLAAMAKYNDGFQIAEEDLKIRGPGEFFGSRQHGLTELKIANPLTQMQLLKRARHEAVKLLDFDPHLEQKQHILLKEKLLQRFPEYQKLIMVG